MISSKLRMKTYSSYKLLIMIFAYSSIFLPSFCLAGGGGHEGLDFEMKYEAIKPYISSSISQIVNENIYRHCGSLLMSQFLELKGYPNHQIMQVGHSNTSGDSNNLVHGTENNWYYSSIGKSTASYPFEISTIEDVVDYEKLQNYIKSANSKVSNGEKTQTLGEDDTQTYYAKDVPFFLEYKNDNKSIVFKKNTKIQKTLDLSLKNDTSSSEIKLNLDLYMACVESEVTGHFITAFESQTLEPKANEKSDDIDCSEENKYTQSEFINMKNLAIKKYNDFKNNRSSELKNDCFENNEWKRRFSSMQAIVFKENIFNEFKNWFSQLNQNNTRESVDSEVELSTFLKDLLDKKSKGENFIFSIFDDFYEPLQSSLMAGYDTTTEHTFFNISKLNYVDWIIGVIHEICHNLDQESKDADLYFSNSKNINSLYDLASKYEKAEQLSDDQKKTIVRWVQAGLNRDVLSEVRVWTRTFKVYLDAKNLKLLPSNEKLEQILATFLPSKKIDSQVKEKILAPLLLISKNNQKTKLNRISDKITNLNELLRSPLITEIIDQQINEQLK